MATIVTQTTTTEVMRAVPKVTLTRYARASCTFCSSGSALSNHDLLVMICLKFGGMEYRTSPWSDTYMCDTITISGMVVVQQNLLELQVAGSAV